MIRILSAGCAGFLVAVLWFDLMFDVQVRGHPAGTLPEPVLSSIAAYYGRVTTDADPMGLLVGTVMAVLLGTCLIGVIQKGSRRRSGLTLLLAAPPIVMAMVRVVPNAVELARIDDAAVQSDLARVIYFDHILCFVAMTAALVAQLWPPSPASSNPDYS